MIYGELDEELQSYVRGISRALARGDRHLADDLEQETFVAALQGRPRDPRATRAWLRGITRNCLRNLRSRTGRRPASVAYTTGVHDSSELSRFGRRDEFDPSGDLQREELRHALEHALERLPEPYAEVITLRVVDGLPPRDIAAALDIPVETVRTRTRRGFERLKDEVARMNVDAEALSEPRPLFTIAGLLATPRRRFAAVAAVTLPTLATVAWLSKPAASPDAGAFVRGGAPAAAAQAPEVAAIGGGAREAAPLLPADPAEAIALCSVDLRLVGASAENGMAVRLSGPSPDRFHEWIAFDGVARTLVDLEPGRWTLSNAEGEELSTRVLRAGESTWDVALAAGVPIEVLVTTAAGRPASGALVYQRRGFDRPPEHVATTDAWGRAEVRATGANQWIAVRGDVGARSEAILLQQPLVMHPRRAELTLREHQVSRVRVVGTDPFEDQPIGICCEPVDPRERCMQSPRGGLRGLSSWLPAWEVAANTFMVVSGNTRKHLCVTASDDVVWTSEAIRRVDPFPSEILIQAPWSVTGRLLSAEGHPIADRPIRVSPSERSRMPNAELRSGPDGRFRVDMVTTSGLSLTCNGREFATAVRPEDGDVVELGDVFHPQVIERVTVHGRVIGVEPPFLVHGMTLDEARIPAPIQLATDAGRQFLVVRDPDGRFDLHAGPARVASIVVAPVEGNETFATTFFERPDAGWPKDALTLEVSPSHEAAALTGRFEPSRLPARAQFLHVESGWRRTIAVPKGDGRFESPPLSDGLWAVSLQDRDGRFAECTRVMLAKGERADLGQIRQRFGRIDIVWPDELAGLPLDATAQLLVMEGNRIAYRAELTRAEIEGEFGSLEVPESDYRISLHVPGNVFMSHERVAAGAIVRAELETGRVTLALRLPRRKLIDAGGAVRLEAHAADGTLLDALTIERDRLADERRYDLVCDRAFPITVRCVASDGVYSTVVERTESPTRGLVSLNPHTGATFEPAR